MELFETAYDIQNLKHSRESQVRNGHFQFFTLLGNHDNSINRDQRSHVASLDLHMNIFNFSSCQHRNLNMYHEI